MTLETITNNGLFNASEMIFNDITESGTEIDMCADVSGCRDPLMMVIDIPKGTSGNFSLLCLGKNGMEIGLSAGKTNVAYITTYGNKKNSMFADFRLITSNSAGFANLGVKVAVVKYRPVINH